jgi:hypothetical protein
MGEKMGEHPSPQASEAPLPAERAFVVQLRGQSHPRADLFVGRVEHVASGDSERFSSAEELLAFITKVLTPAAPSSGESSTPEEPKGSAG